MENVLVQARGLKRRPSVPSRVKTGRKARVMTSSEKKMGRPTSCSAETTTALRVPGRPACSQASSRLWTFSTTMIAASTMAPMAMAMPPSDMMLAPSPIQRIGMKASNTATGSMRTGTSVLRTCEQEDEDDQGDDDKLFDERVPQGGDAGLDELRPVVGGDDFHAPREASAEARAVEPSPAR